ncbi:hypothetical protein [Gimesia panareensis]|uniref:hypothetical protein n=1 Tax=Gimesia panareensis TaxID=2527978 RepID=UPI00118CE588|nr:hypothetical protein [Gimesia panareensis]QDU51437.1 hypothetical protein Pan110_38030 [Gimesia panareensis]
MKKKATRKSASKKQTPPKKKTPKKKTPKKKAVKKKTAKKGTAKKQGAKKKTTKKAVKKKAAPKKTAPKKAATKKTAAKKSAPKAAAAKKAVKKTSKNQGGAVEHPLQGKSTVFASSKTNEWQPYPLLRIVERKEVRQEMESRRDELDAQYEKAKIAYKILSKELDKQRKQREQKEGKKAKVKQKQLKDYGDVTGMAICFRTKYGLTVSPLQYVLMLNVANKKSMHELGQRKIDPLPTAINDTPVKVVQGTFELADSNTPIGINATGHGILDPPDPEESLIGGQPIAQASTPNKFGTLGIVFGENGANYGITNKHVAARPKKVIRLTESGSQQIGKVEKSIASGRTDDQTNEVYFCDASYLSLDLPKVPDVVKNVETVPYKIEGYDDLPSGMQLDIFFSNRIVDNHESNCPVYKFGARTGELKEGFLASTTAEVVIVSGPPKRNLLLAASELEGFLLPGDSGSLLLMKADVKDETSGDDKLVWMVIGIVFAQLQASSKVAFACQISQVIKRLQLDQLIDNSRLVSQWKPSKDTD